MFTSKQYRAKANEYFELAKKTQRPNELREFQDLERRFTELADNAQWVADNHNKIVQATKRATAPLTSDTAALITSQQ